MKRSLLIVIVAGIAGGIVGYIRERAIDEATADMVAGAEKEIAAYYAKYRPKNKERR